MSVFCLLLLFIEDCLEFLAFFLIENQLLEEEISVILLAHELYFELAVFLH